MKAKGGRGTQRDAEGDRGRQREAEEDRGRQMKAESRLLRAWILSSWL